MVECGKCGKPVSKIGPAGAWVHSMTRDYMGPCWWGKPWKPPTYQGATGVDYAGEK